MNKLPETNFVDAKKSLITYSATAAVMVSVAIYIIIGQTVGGTLISLYPLLRGWEKDLALNWLNSSVVAQFSFVLLTEASSILMLYSYLQYKRAKFVSIGFERRPKWSDLGLSLISWGLYFLCVVIAISVLQNIFPELNINQKQQTGFEHIRTNLDLILTFASLVMLAPVAEEILARGFLYSGLKEQLPKRLAILCTSLLFAVAHLQLGSGEALLWVAAIDTFILSIFLCKLKDLTGSLWSSIFLHMFKNLMAFVLLFVIPM